MRLEWSPLSEQCLEKISTYVKETSGQRAAEVLLQRIYDKAGTLIDFPLIGKTVPILFDPRLRELLEGSYRIIYEVDALDAPTEVSILGVIHSAQMLQNTLLQELFNNLLDE